MLYQFHAGRETNPLIDGTAEVLEREGIDGYLALRLVTWIRASLEIRSRS